MEEERHLVTLAIEMLWQQNYNEGPKTRQVPEPKRLNPLTGSNPGPGAHLDANSRI